MCFMPCVAYLGFASLKFNILSIYIFIGAYARTTVFAISYRIVHSAIYCDPLYRYLLWILCRLIKTS